MHIQQACYKDQPWKCRTGLRHIRELLHSGGSYSLKHEFDERSDEQRISEQKAHCNGNTGNTFRSSLAQNKDYMLAKSITLLINLFNTRIQT